MALYEKDLLQRIEDLEKRVAALEGSPKQATDVQLHVVDEYETPRLVGPGYNSEGSLNFTMLYSSGRTEAENRKTYTETLAEFDLKDPSQIWRVRISEIPSSCICLLSDGSLQTRSKIGDTLREVKAFASLVGFPIPDKAKTAALAASIVAAHGANGVCIAQGQMLSSKGVVYGLTKTDLNALIKNATDKAKAFNVPQVPKLEGKTGAEKLELIKEFFGSITPKPYPSRAEAKKQYIAAVELYKKSNSLKF